MDHNQELNDKLIEFIENGPEETRPFSEFTSWEWDTVKVVNLEAIDDAEVEAMTGEAIDVPVSQSGLFCTTWTASGCAPSWSECTSSVRGAIPVMLWFTGGTLAGCRTSRAGSSIPAVSADCGDRQDVGLGDRRSITIGLFRTNS